MRSQVRISIGPIDSGLAWSVYRNVRHCAVLPNVLLQLKDPLELFEKRKEFLRGSGFHSRRDMTSVGESDVKQSLPIVLP